MTTPPRPLVTLALLAVFAVASAAAETARDHYRLARDYMSEAKQTSNGIRLAVLGWMTLMLVSIRQTQAWHSLLLVPWIFARAPSGAVRFGRIELIAVVTTAVFL